ncbi:hypothetical protein BG004_003477 [Podila humilis]|nr:hypothetical protein BG004_003477 [Podila humilis]
MSSLRIQPLTSKNRAEVVQVVFDQHMRAVPALYNFLKLRPVTLLVWTAISTMILKVKRTNLYDYSEVMMILGISVLLAHGILFLILLFEASSTAPGEQVVGRLEEFANQDQDQDEGQESSVNTSTSTATTNGSTTKKRSTGTSSSSPSSSSSSNDNNINSPLPREGVTTLKKTKKEDNLFWVLEKDQVAIGSLGALIDYSQEEGKGKGNGEAQLVNWAVSTKHQNSGAGTLLLRTALDELFSSSSSSSSQNPKKKQLKKNKKIESVKVVVQGHQITALRIFYNLGFKQLDRTPEWLGERVVLELLAKDWIKK